METANCHIHYVIEKKWLYRILFSDIEKNIRLLEEKLDCQSNDKYSGFHYNINGTAISNVFNRSPIGACILTRVGKVVYYNGKGKP